MRWSAYTITIDEYGGLSNLEQYVEPFQTGMRKMAAATDGGYAVAGFLSEAQATMYLLKIDGQGNQEFSRLVGRASYTNHATTLCPTPDGGFLMGGEIQPYDSTATAPPTHPYLVKVDAAGEVGWDTIYWGSSPPRARVIDIDRVPGEDAYYLLIPDGVSYDTCDIWIVKINGSGEILWERTINLGYGEYPQALHLTKDGGFLISAAYKVGSAIDGYVIKTDSLGSIEWINPDHFHGLGPMGKVVELEDSSFVVSSSDRRYIPGVGYDIDAELVKLNADGGEVWHRTFGTPENDQYFYDMAATPGGGFIMCGRDETGIGASVYVVKTNCMGLLTEPAAEFEYEAVDASNIQFINQSQYVYPDSTDGGHYLWDFGDGGTSSEPHPQHTYPDAAEYEVTLTAVVCSDTSVYTRTVSTTPTGIKPQARAGSITVLPNPADNTVSISTYFEDADMQLTFTLYDINGKAVETMPLNGRESRVLAIGNLAEGIYYCMIKGGGKVWHRDKLLIIR